MKGCVTEAPMENELQKKLNAKREVIAQARPGTAPNAGTATNTNPKEIGRAHV